MREESGEVTEETTESVTGRKPTGARSFTQLLDEVRPKTVFSKVAIRQDTVSFPRRRENTESH